MDKYLKNKKYAIFISLFCMLLWGSAIPMIKSLYTMLEIAPDDTGSKILIAGLRFFIAGILTIIYYYLFSDEKIRKKDINFRFIILMAIVQITLQYIFYYIGLSNTLGVKASIIQASNAFIIVVLSAVLMKNDPLTKKKIISLILGTVGVIVVNFNSSSSGLSFTFSGEGAIIISTTLNALGTVLVKKYGQKQNSFVISIGQFIIGSVPIIILGLYLHKAPLNFTVNSFLLLVYGSFISATAFTLWYMVLKYQKSGEFGIYKLFIPIFGSLFSVIFLNEKFTVYLSAGMILVIIGSLILNIKTKKVG